eukprot:160615-Prorocentrum_minimum.AAC.1
MRNASPYFTLFGGDHPLGVVYHQSLGWELRRLPCVGTKGNAGDMLMCVKHAPANRARPLWILDHGTNP